MPTLREPLYLPDDLKLDSVSQRFTKTLLPLFRVSSEEDVRQSIAFTMWSLSGAKWKHSFETLPLALPAPHALAELVKAAAPDPLQVIQLALNMCDQLPPIVQSDVQSYITAVTEHVKQLDHLPVPSSDVWRAVLVQDVKEIALLHGVGSHLLDRFEPGLAAAAYVMQKHTRFFFAKLPLLAVLLPFLPQDLPEVLATTPEWTEGMWAVRQLAKIISFLGRTRSLHVSEAFRNGQGRVPNNPVTAAILAAIWRGGKRARMLSNGWSMNSSGDPVYVHNGNRGGRIIIYPCRCPDAAGPVATAEAQWELVEALNPFSADVALAVLAQMVEPSHGDQPKYPFLEPVLITPDTILAYAGFRRWGKERNELRNRVAQEMERLGALQFEVEKYPVWHPERGRWENKGVSWKGDRLFEVVKLQRNQKRSLGGREQLEVSWLVRAGRWAYWWLNAQGRVYMSRMPRVLLELDHRANRGPDLMAKKLGQRVVLLGSALRADGPLELFVGRLLESVGELPVPEERARDWAGRIRERFDEATQKLQELGVFARVEWPNGHGPGDPDRSKGWVERWLDAKVRVYLPEATPELPKQNRAMAVPSHRQRSSPKNTEEPRIDGASVRRTRMERGWSQDDLARYLGISTPYLSQIENEKRRPSPKLWARIHAWVRSAG